MKILVAADGSKYGEQAAAQCGELISRMEEPVAANIFVRIITIDDRAVDFESEAFASEEEFLAAFDRASKEKTSKILKRAEDIIRYHNPGIQIEQAAHVGSPTKLIVKEAEDWDADLIVVGSHGHGFLKRTFLGSVSDAIVRYSPCSVLVARSGE
ncbi:MAG: universal stress protein [Acidobacteria bacterium]|nr:universal stress protein [Acidobacteriota bacterium]